MVTIPLVGSLEDDALWRRFDSGSLHGLWRNNCSTCPHDYPYHCSNQAFDINAIARGTLRRMYDDWPSGVGREGLTAAKLGDIASDATTQEQCLSWHQVPADMIIMMLCSTENEESPSAISHQLHHTRISQELKHRKRIKP